MTLAVAALFLAAVCGFAAQGLLPPLVAGLYLAASVVTAIVYRSDKSASQTGAWRTPESTLHLLALIGGWPGAVIAQRMFRHKSRKTSFQLAFVATVALNCAALAWFWWKTRA